MSEALDAWRAERDRRLRLKQCACPSCLPYPNATEADRWRPGRPIPEGWTYEQGWGLTCAEPWW